MKKPLVVAASAVVLLASVVAGVGALLPVAHTATVERTLRAPPEAVWVAISNPRDFPAWRTDVDAVTLLAPRGGLPAWVERNGADSLTLVVTELDPPRRMVTRIADTGIPFGGTWTYVVADDGAGSRIRITEDGEIYNPVFRFLARFFLGYEGTLEAYVDALEARVAGVARRKS